MAMLPERVHPEVVATLQLRLSKSLELNETVKLDDETIGFVNASVDTCSLAGSDNLIGYGVFPFIAVQIPTHVISTHWPRSIKRESA